MGLKKWVKKIEGGAKKHGGYGRALDHQLGNPSHLKSSIKEKRNAAEERFGFRDKTPTDEKSQEPEDLTLREHLAKEPMDDASKMLVSAILGNPSLTDSQLTAALLPLGNPSINQVITSWVQNHISNAVTIETLSDTIAGISSQSAEELEITGETVQEIIASAFALGNTPLTCAITEICLKDPEPVAEEEPAPEAAPVAVDDETPIDAEEESKDPVDQVKKEVDETPAQQAEEVNANEESEGLKQIFPTSQSFDGPTSTESIEELKVAGATENEFEPLDME